MNFFKGEVGAEASADEWSVGAKVQSCFDLCPKICVPGEGNWDACVEPCAWIGLGLGAKASVSDKGMHGSDVNQFGVVASDGMPLVMMLELQSSRITGYGRRREQRCDIPCGR